MAFHPFGKLLILSASITLLLACSNANVDNHLDHHFSIVGYKPHDLSCIDKLIRLFESWTERHGKIYHSIEEKLHRFEVFRDNLEHIDETNKNVKNYWLGLNEFSDLTHEEFKSKYLGLKVNTPRSGKGSEFSYKDVQIEDLPKNVDWRSSCWAFSTVAAVEGINQIVTGNLTALSEQELVDCDTENNSGCNGGLMDYAFQYIMGSGGLHKEEDYPYLMEEGTCESTKDLTEMITIDGYHDVPANDEASLITALAHQPVSVAVDASGRDFQFYSGGVFDGHCGIDLDHGVAAVGYGTSKGLDYVIVKNSWGSRWGEKGFIKLKRSTGKPEGLCGINKMASYPTKTN
ncbi:hypothetical protein KSS87_004200 [Heliosperma pusillum]|nr:hypothetical protein KSS87_004200 [Heliosperma pusillum]